MSGVGLTGATDQADGATAIKETDRRVLSSGELFLRYVNDARHGQSFNPIDAPFAWRPRSENVAE
jgi:hypothetical protein